MRPAKLAAIGTAVVLVLLAAAGLALHRALPPERLRELIVRGAGSALHREVRLGRATVGLLSGLTLRDVAVSEKPSFSAGTFASVRKFQLKVRWAPLLQRRIVVDSLSAEGLSVSLARGRDGSLNVSDLVGLSSAPATAAAPAGAVLSLAVRSLRLREARLSYREEGADRALELSDVDARVSGFSLSGPFDARLSLAAKGRWDGRPVDGSASLAGRLDLGGSDPSAFRADVSSLRAAALGWSASASGRVEGLAQPALDVKLALSRGSRRLGRAAFKGRLRLPSSPRGFAADGALSLAADALPPEDARALGLPAGLAVPAFKMAGTAGYSGDAVRFKDLSVTGAFGRLGVSGGAAALSSGKPSVDAEISAALDLPAMRSDDAPWLKLPPGLSLPPLKVSGRARVKGDSASTPGLSISGAFGAARIAGSARALLSSKPDFDLTLSGQARLPALRAAELPWAGLPAGFRSPPLEVEGEGRLTREELALSRLAVAGKAGSVEASGTVRALLSGTPEPDLSLKLALSLPALVSADVPWPGVPAGLALPASRWNGSLEVSRDEVRIPSLRAVVGSSDFEIVGGRLGGLRAASPTVAGLVKCRRFSLEELGAASAATRDLRLTGGGLFAVGATGRLPRPVLQGKLRFKDVGAAAGGLSLAGFTGTASFSDRRIDVPNLSGRVGDGELSMDLTIKDYVRAPDVQLQASLTRFDLGRWLAAKAALARPAPAAPAAPAAPDAAAQAAPPPAISASGRLTVGELLHPNADARDVRLEWDVTGLGSDLRRLNGAAKFSSSSGHFSNLGGMAVQSKLVKILLIPFIVVQKIGRLVGRRVLDFDDVDYDRLQGDYAFKDGLMTLRDTRLNSTVAGVEARGEVDLPAEKLDLTVTAQVGHVPPVDIDVRGTFEDPKTKVRVVKALTDLITK